MANDYHTEKYSSRKIHVYTHIIIGIFKKKTHYFHSRPGALVHISKSYKTIILWATDCILDKLNGILDVSILLA